MDLRYRTVGLSETVQYLQNSIPTIQNPSHHCVRPVLRFQPYPSHRSSNSLFKQVAIDRYDTFHNRTTLHPNPLIQYLSTPQLPDNPIRRLRRQWPRDLLNQQAIIRWMLLMSATFITIILCIFIYFYFIFLFLLYFIC